MAEDKQNIGAFLSSLGGRRVGVDHWTEEDFEMERVGRKQSAETYAKRLEILEAHGWTPFSAPFYYGNREWHGGHHPPGTKKYVPTKVAFAMFLEANPEVELPVYKPHPHGWKSPKPPEGAGLFHVEQLTVEPMKMPAGALFALADSYEYGTEEEKRERRERHARMDATFKDLPGVRSYGDGTRYSPEGSEKYIRVLLEAEEHRVGLPETWEGLRVDVKVESEADERAKKEAKRHTANEKHREEAEWIRKARKF